MAQRVGEYLKQDPLKIRFTSSNPQNSQPKNIVKRALNQSVADITSTQYYSAQPNVVVYYELLEISIVELETKKALRVNWTGSNNKEEVSCRVRRFSTPLTTGDIPVLVAQDEHLQRCVRRSPQGGQAVGSRKRTCTNLRHQLERPSATRIHFIRDDWQPHRPSRAVR